MEWGTQPIVTRRTDITAQAQSHSTLGTFEMHYVNYLDPFHLARANFPDQQGFINQTLQTLRENGAEPIYINVNGSEATVIYKGCPFPWAVIGVLIAASILLGILYLVITKLYEITIVDIPFIGKVPLLPVIIVGGLVIVGLILIRRARER